MNEPMPLKTGSHWLGDLHGCECTPALMASMEALRALCVDAVRESGLTVVGHTFHQFDPIGATGVVVLAESHLAVHTWPELGFVSIDLYVCNVQTDNDAKAAALFRRLVAAFAPRDERSRCVKRGD